MGLADTLGGKLLHMLVDLRGQPAKLRVVRDSCKKSQEWDNLLLVKNFFGDSCRPSMIRPGFPRHLKAMENG